MSERLQAVMNRKQSGASDQPRPQSVIDTQEAGEQPAPGAWSVRLRRTRTLRRGVCSLLVGAVLWEVVGRLWANPLFFPPLSKIWTRFLELLANGELPQDIAASAQEYAAGLVLAIVFGTAIGIVMSASRFMRDILDPWVSAMYATPVLALAPLFILIFGLGIQSKVAVVFLVMIFPILINTLAGFSSTDEQLVEAARSYSANSWQVYVKVKLPMALPFLVAGLRLAASHGLVGIVVAEFFGARQGVGLMIEQSAQTFDTRALFVGIFILGLTGVAITYGLMAVERRLSRWRHQEAEEA